MMYIYIYIYICKHVLTCFPCLSMFKQYEKYLMLGPCTPLFVHLEAARTVLRRGVRLLEQPGQGAFRAPQGAIDNSSQLAGDIW